MQSSHIDCYVIWAILQNTNFALKLGTLVGWVYNFQWSSTPQKCTLQYQSEKKSDTYLSEQKL
jgi:hypothetical protein